MKKINKQASPEWFELWKAQFRSANHREPVYKDDLPDDKRRLLRKTLVEEQGYICCYCMERIGVDSSHLEHFWPKEKFTSLDMDFENMLASCEGNTDGGDHCGHRKNNWYSERMVIPVKDEIEKMFYYTADGEIHPSGKNEAAAAAKEMIQNLGLDSYHLERNRRNAIAESEVYDDVDYTQDAILDIIDYYKYMDNGKYVPYCRAIEDALIAEYL